jgi:hypothetical protein
LQYIKIKAHLVEEKPPPVEIKRLAFCHRTDMVNLAVLMTRNPEYKVQWRYWLNVLALYALAEAVIQLLFLFILNTFGKNPISLIEFHFVMWLMQCLLIVPIWGAAWLVRKKGLLVQIAANIVFYIIYTRFWFGPVQEAIGFLYNHLVQFTRTEGNRLQAYLDRGDEYSYINYQLLKHAYRLSWFFLAAYFYNYRTEEKKRLALAIANKALQLKSLTWQLNPSFYFKTISHLKQIASQKPVNTTGPILQLSKVMEYVIYEAKEKQIAVQKEIQFLRNYIQLMNGQPGNSAQFEIVVAGAHEHLKITPLLLTGVIDAIAAVNNNSGRKTTCEMVFQFSGNNMELNITGVAAEEKTDLLPPGASVTERLNELYAGRHSTAYRAATGELTIQIQLDDE